MLRQGHLGTVNEWVNVKVQVLTLIVTIYSTVNFLTLDGFRPLTLCLARSLDWIMWVKWWTIRLFIYLFLFYICLSLKEFSSVWRSISSAISPCKKGCGLSLAKNKKLNPFIPCEKHVYVFSMCVKFPCAALCQVLWGHRETAIH